MVVGGGPAGAAVATLVARQGSNVALFEARRFPRFHVGESLIPAVNRTLEKLGVLADLDALGFPRKHAVQFYSAKGPSRPFYFSEVSDPGLHFTWQVLRSQFDALLLDNARAAGVDVFTRTNVMSVEEGSHGVSGVHVSRGVERTVRARVVVDASGQKGLLATRLGRRANIAGLENAAVYAHYSGVERDQGVDAGSTIIFRTEERVWLWFIPLPETVSIGLVTPAERISGFAGPAASILDAAIAACPPLAQRLHGAERTTNVRVERDFSYRARQDGGPGWLLVGDALGFIDPVYSTGLFLSMLSAELAAAAVTDRLARGDNDFGGFATRYAAAFDRFLVLVRAFYDGFRFSELARHGNHRQGLVDLLTGLVDTPEAVAVSRALAVPPSTSLPRSGRGVE